MHTVGAFIGMYVPSIAPIKSGILHLFKNASFVDVKYSPLGQIITSGAMVLSARTTLCTQ